MMQDRIFSFTSDLDLNKEFALNLGNRFINQKFLYIGDEGSSAYYKSLSVKQNAYYQKGLSAQDYFDFLKVRVNKNQKIALISLGCGSSKQENVILSNLAKEGYDVTYFGIDISKSMLEESRVNLQEIPIKKNFIRADFSDNDFKDNILSLTRDYDRKIIAFLGFTFVNTTQTAMADTLYNMVGKEDLLWLDILARPSLSKLDDMKIFSRYADYLKHPEIVAFYFRPLKQAGVPYKNGEMHLSTSEEKSVGALVAIFSFAIKKKVVIDFRGETKHLLPNENIVVQRVRAYHSDTLITFFKEHDFKLLDKSAQSGQMQLIFSKK
ncbi:MAG: hypothetical protein COU22_03325 [Candidatus Komeilibacteria bacterium CG10_big_fil_rev_8_21_14_0_10_41_13]|uniref:Histidine-specific methyltransferase SAM-dependent domain-containing protein n=1 Tax=Candidatus Komeilibacteria bacterium CG10_big_fil_rev_8_21_14_0_10_41_13 TaxID=1974476 RepID=A0A2M6WBS0_9BACT|nr:MAG: hypothetical protein COU22_03325 [Candidatus Komeilibacteria bacterium CG10_big_fil_rev_8_21_14_0_10_41_13]